MAWTLTISETAKKQLKKLDKSIQEKILTYLLNKVTTRNNPSSLGKSLGQNLNGYWRYRIGDYRVICEIQDDELVILVLKVGHRKNVYE